MKKTALMIALASFLSLGLFATNSHAARTMGKNGFMMFNSSDLIGAPAEDSQGGTMGIVDEVRVDFGGHAFAAVIRLGYDLYGEGGVNSFMPFQELRISQIKAGQVTVVPITDMEHLDFAPYLNPPKTDSRQFGANNEYYGIQPYWIQSGTAGKSGFMELNTFNLVGATVENPIGEVVGSIDDFVVDSNGHIDFVILTYNFPWEYAPVPPQSIAVPFSEITVKPNGKVAVLKFSGWKLELAPKFAKGDMNNRKWAINDYRYFGLRPPWTERETTGGMNPYMWRGW